MATTFAVAHQIKPLLPSDAGRETAETREVKTFRAQGLMGCLEATLSTEISRQRLRSLWQSADLADGRANLCVSQMMSGGTREVDVAFNSGLWGVDLSDWLRRCSGVRLGIWLVVD